MDYLVFYELLKIVGFSEAEWPECLGECVDLGFDLGGRTEGESVDEEYL